jgi:hypothetical protein
MTFYISITIGLLAGIAIGLMIVAQELMYRERKYKKLWESDD